MREHDAELDRLDAALDALARAIRHATPDGLGQPALGLHQALVRSNHLRAKRLSPESRRRLTLAAQRLAQLRGELSRRRAAIERELAVLMPAAPAPTYEPLKPGGGLRR